MQLSQLVMQADGGQAIDRVAHQFNLTREQTEAAIDALMPAFSAGIARQTREPQQAASFLRALGSGRHAQYVNEPDRAFSQQGHAEGVGILGHLFGNKDVSREVATRAAAQSGLPQGLLKKLLPVLAPIVMGAIVKGLDGRSGGAGGFGRSIGEAAGGGLLGTILGSLAEGMMSGAGNGRRVPTPQRRRAGRRRGGLEDVLGDLMGGGRSGGGAAGGGLGDLLGGMLGGASNRRITPQRGANRAERPSGRVAPRRAPAGRSSVFEQLRGEGPARRARAPQGGLFGALTEPGGRTDPGYRREVGSVFDRLLGN